jgi:hypothetical protein
VTDEEEFQAMVLQRIDEAGQLTGYSFAGLRKIVAADAVGAARRLIAPTSRNLGSFPQGMRVLFNAGLLHLSIEQAVIEFGEQGRLFTPEEVAYAKDRIALIQTVFSRRRPG